MLFAGRTTEALDLGDLVLSSPGLPSELRAKANTYRARLLLLQGKAASAVKSLKDAAFALRADPSFGSWCLALLAEAEALLGHAETASTARSESLSLRSNDRLPFFVDERRALAWVDVQGGRVAHAIAQLWSAADMALERGQRCFELIILHDLLRMGEGTAAARAQGVSNLVEGSLGEAIGLHARAVVSQRGADFEAAAVSFTRISSWLVASELWAAASAEYRREGLLARSSKAAKRSFEVAELCEGARVQTAISPDHVEPLSRRQREVALLAARGATNTEIARALFLSVRTVENHLYAAFVKLGLTTRDELNAALIEPVSGQAPAAVTKKTRETSHTD